MSGTNKFPFTASQWQELEHQALIFKYMVLGIAIPPDLLFTIKRSCFFDRSPHSLKLFPHPHQHWRRVDPEPGRCRRTDGKKWRCSEEAYPDSKYCERHMHRGKNRSRKPVEPQINTPYSSFTTMNSSRPLFYSATKHQHSFNLNSTHSFLDSASASACKRYLNGQKEEVDDEHAFFLEPSGKLRACSSVSSMDDSLQLIPLSMSSSPSSSSSNQKSCDYPYLQLQTLADQIHTPKQQEAEVPKTVVHRFFDEWPPNSGDSWPHLDDKSSKDAALSTASLSISIPTAHDFPVFSLGAHDRH